MNGVILAVLAAAVFFLGQAVGYASGAVEVAHACDAAYLGLLK